MVKIFIERERRTVEETHEGDIKTLLEHIGVNLETVLVVKNGEVVAEDELVVDDDELKLLSVISGG